MPALFGARLAGMGACAAGWTGVSLAEVARVAPPGRVGVATSATGLALALIASPSLRSGLAGLAGGYGAGVAACAGACLGPVLARQGGIAFPARQAKSAR